MKFSLQNCLAILQPNNRKIHIPSFMFIFVQLALFDAYKNQHKKVAVNWLIQKLQVWLRKIRRELYQQGIMQCYDVMLGVKRIYQMQKETYQFSSYLEIFETKGVVENRID
eukprot:TRINITY_DN8612_c1_g1_i1.p3 TRINITY_DN8612_c1_g1~~TRINITY_DN8612_c1_g1_i1.p3  ORF type:complete len:111 (-),score=3.86 TRINITY_DN8612_c1_g1_i1:155-487(-)